MEYTAPEIVDLGPDVCVSSLREYKPGYYQMLLLSRYGTENPQPWEVDQQTVDNLMDHPEYPIAFCPPGWPETNCMEYHSARIGVSKAEEWCFD